MVSQVTGLLFNDYRRKVLSLLLLNPEKKYHVREIARLTSTIAGTLHKELSRLYDADLLVKEKVGNQVLYAANKQCFVFPELVKLLDKLSKKDNSQHKMHELVEQNREKILKIAEENGIYDVRVFGSMARNDADSKSDLDLLVSVKEGKSGFVLGGFLSDVSELVHRKVDVVTEQSLHPKIRAKVLKEAKFL